MSTPLSSVVEMAARLLEASDREAVLGDLAESSETPVQALRQISGLVLRRQLHLWRSWRPWLTAFGLALPGTLLLLGLSFTISSTWLQLVKPAILHATGLTFSPGLSLLLCDIVLLLGWSWAGGYVMGSLSRRTIWISAAFSLIPCISCLSRFHIESMSRLCLLLFLPTAIWGVQRGLNKARLNLPVALALAVFITLFTFPSWRTQGPWIPNWALSWPAWYLVVMAARSRRQRGSATPSAAS